MTEPILTTKDLKKSFGDIEAVKGISFNVLRGEMTIVGPRPQIPSEVSRYTPGQALRLEAKPGLTCLWQVSGRSHLDFEEWMELDGDYVRRRGIAMDLMILLRTLPAVIERKGAY